MQYCGEQIAKMSHGSHRATRDPARVPVLMELTAVPFALFSTGKTDHSKEKVGGGHTLLRSSGFYGGFKLPKII